ncbi:2-oxo-tetronate isomerase [Roseateles oligotrophus]|uniref:Hydroxypyruvate isomerase family protein n=1 Tax=Roseateles oligotrophus TaxID=1769250 RepID=A0ABT2YE31_9BURK|nr:2-oxo-tetronate isomerase [Roseateles oligotrophus]MCV2368309.1 hydroxypyruvate isomerase family protein [Roseateles oligotrophus]
MPRFAANLSMLYTEHAFLDRFKAAAADGFKAVEFLFPYEYPPAALADCLLRHGLSQALFNAPPGDWAAGERGLACLPGRQAEFRAGLDRALDYAAALNCSRIHVMAGIQPEDASPNALQTNYLDNLAWAAERARAQAVDICIEPINRRDMPGYFLCGQAQALKVIETIAAPNLRLQFDAYHCQISEGDVTNKLRQAITRGVLGHVQLAGVPDRHEPDQGELRVDGLLGLLDELGYSGFVGCEYRPRAGTREGLGWLKPWFGAGQFKG